MPQESGPEYLMSNDPNVQPTHDCLDYADDPRARFIDTEERFWGIGGSFRYLICPKCGTWVLTPPPSDALLALHYEGYYPPEEYYQREAQPINAVERARAQQTVDTLDQMGALSQLTHVLESGTGCAGFLAGLQALTDVSVRGCDQSKTSAEFAKRLLNIDVDVGTVADQDPNQQQYGLITLWHCFEHVRSPQQTLRDIGALLSSDGILLMEVPTPGFWARWFKGTWLFLQAPTHLNLFTDKALSAHLNAAGFEVLRSERPWSPSEWAGSLLFRFGFSGFMPRIYFGPRSLSDHLWRLLFFLLMPLDLILTAMSAAFGASGLLRVYAKRRMNTDDQQSDVPL